MTEIEVLKEAFRFIAEQLEEGRAYCIQDDRFVTGDEMHKLLADFARKRADGDNLAWMKWCKLRANANLTG
jgi:hypothetical protein